MIFETWSSDASSLLNEIQSETGEGPCIDPMQEHEVFETGGLGAEDRWPNFATRSYDETGIGSVVALPLFVEQNMMGALNLHHSPPSRRSLTMGYS